MFSKADPHKQLFQLLLTIQGRDIFAITYKLNRNH